ncbi:MAG TPA: hypothetical protein VH601_00430 [Bryobacteraceae bacterium]|jgi:hypothetical protein
MLFKRLCINENERVIVTRNGSFASLLLPGVYRLFVWPFTKIETESYDITKPMFRSRWEGHLLGKRPDLVAAHFMVVETTESEIAMIFVNGMLYQVLLPGKRALFWKDAASVLAEMVTVIESELPEPMLTALEG